MGYLQVFCDIIETRSFSKAAARNFISQPAVSQQVKALEEHFHQKLIERSPQGIYPTEAGRLFYEGIREILERYQNLERQMLDLTQSVSGTIRVATVYSVGLHDLPPFVKKFIQAYPQARIHVEYSRTNRIYEAVRQNQVDIGIVAYPQESRQLGVVPLPSDELMVIVAPEHPLAREANPVELKQLSTQSFVAFEPDIPTRKAIDRVLHDHGVETKIVQEFDNVETIKRSVEADCGVSIIPRRCATLEVRSGSLVALPIADMKVERPVGVIYKRGKTFSNTLQKFIAVLTGRE
jgi:LysR family transcriptional regulator, transcriptional activator of the cysJI operon